MSCICFTQSLHYVMGLERFLFNLVLKRCFVIFGSLKDI